MPIQNLSPDVLMMRPFQNSDGCDGAERLRAPKIVSERWRVHYNTVKPHSSLGYSPTAPEAIAPPPAGTHPSLQVRPRLTYQLVETIRQATVTFGVAVRQVTGLLSRLLL